VKNKVVVVGMILLAIVVIVVLVGQNQVGPDPVLVVGDSRTITLRVDWGGDVYQSERQDCGVWTALFNCELRRGGGLGVIMTQTIPITATAAIGEPGTGQWGSEVTLTWDISGLDFGLYETFTRLEVTDGTETKYGYVEGSGHDGNMFVMVDKFQVGQTCFVPLRYSVAVP